MAVTITKGGRTFIITRLDRELFEIAEDGVNGDDAVALEDTEEGARLLIDVAVAEDWSLGRAEVWSSMRHSSRKAAEQIDRMKKDAREWLRHNPEAPEEEDEISDDNLSTFLILEVAKADKAKRAPRGPHVEYFLRKYQPLAMGVSMKILQNKADAEAAASEALYKALNKIWMYDDTTAKLSTWLHTIIRNNALDARKKRERQRKREENDAARGEFGKSVDELGATDAVQEQLLLDREEARERGPMRSQYADPIRAEQEKVIKHWDNLSPVHQEILQLRLFEKPGEYMSYKDMAARLGVPMGTVMSRLSKARTKMSILEGVRTNPSGFVVVDDDGQPMHVTPEGEPVVYPTKKAAQKGIEAVAEQDPDIGHAGHIESYDRLLERIADADEDDYRENPGHYTNKQQLVYVETMDDAHCLCEAGIITKAELKLVLKQLRAA